MSSHHGMPSAWKDNARHVSAVRLGQPRQSCWMLVPAICQRVVRGTGRT